MELSPAMARRIIAEAVTHKVLVITVTELEQKELKRQFIEHVKKMRIWEFADRRNFLYHVHIKGIEPICIMDYGTWEKESKQVFSGIVFTTSRCLPDKLQNINVEPIVLRDIMEGQK